MDNNVLACSWGIEQLESMACQNVRIDFNQGLDARLITRDVAALLPKLRWIRFIRMSCDTDAVLETVLLAIDRLRVNGIKPYRVFVYLLVQDVESAERRALSLRNAGVEIFAQPYRDFDNNVEPTQAQRAFARWVNRKAIFKSTHDFSEYNPHRKTEG